MALKNFQNRLLEKGPSANFLKDPALAEDFDLVDFDDKPQPKSRQKEEYSAPVREPNKNANEIIPNPHSESEDFLPSQSGVEAVSTPKSLIIDEPTGEKISCGLPLNNIEIQPNPQETRKEPTSNTQETHKKPTINSQRTRKKPTRNLQAEIHQSIESTSNSQETHKKPYEKPTSEPTSNSQRTDNKLTRISFRLLTGTRRDVVLFLYENCKAARSDTSDPFTFTDLGQYCRTTARSAGETLKLLAKEGYLTKVDGKGGGKGAWHIYQIPDEIYQDILLLENSGKLTRNLQETHKKPYEKPTSEPTRSDSSSSSSLINESLKLTTTGNEPASIPSGELPDEWQAVDFSELNELGIHFGRSHLKQWHDRKYCTAIEAQESISHFAFHLRHTKKEDYRTGPLNFFMGVMAKNHYFGRPDGYMSPDELKLKQIVEDERKANVERKKLQEEIIELKFEAWFDSLTGTEIDALTPMLKSLDAKRAMLKQTFRETFSLIIKDNPHIEISQLKGKLQGLEKEKSTREFLAQEIRHLADAQFGPVREN